MRSSYRAGPPHRRSPVFRPCYRRVTRAFRIEGGLGPGDRTAGQGAARMSERAGSTVVEVAGSHAIYVSQPAAVAALIQQAAAAVAAG
jgi:hypothetical protein